MMKDQLLGVWKKFLINGLTLSRIPFSILFNIMLFDEKNRFWGCSLLFLLIALTDFWDGRLARYYGVETKIGAILDVGADFFFIFTASIFLYGQGLLPLGMLVIIGMKFAEFCLTSYLINKIQKKNRILFFDKIGRLLAVVLYFIPLATVLLDAFLHRRVLENIMCCAMITIGTLALISGYVRMRGILKPVRGC